MFYIAIEQLLLLLGLKLLLQQATPAHKVTYPPL